MSRSLWGVRNVHFGVLARDRSEQKLTISLLVAADVQHRQANKARKKVEQCEGKKYPRYLKKIGALSSSTLANTVNSVKCYELENSGTFTEARHTGTNSTGTVIHTRENFQ